MNLKDVIAQVEIKFLELWVYEGMDYPENQDQAFEKFKSFLSSYTKDLLLSVESKITARWGKKGEQTDSLGLIYSERDAMRDEILDFIALSDIIKEIK